MEIVKIKISGYTQRTNVVAALAENGYKVWIEEVDKFPSGEDYVVCFELKEASNEDR